MAQFLTTLEQDIKRCRHSMLFRVPVTMTAEVDGVVRVVNGIISGIEPVKGTLRMWTVTVDEVACGTTISCV